MTRKLVPHFPLRPLRGQPLVQLGARSVHYPAWGAFGTPHRQPVQQLPALHRTYTFAQIRGDFFPRSENLRIINGGHWGPPTIFLIPPAWASYLFRLRPEFGFNFDAGNRRPESRRSLPFAGE